MSDNHKKCHRCGRQVGFPLWLLQRDRRKKPTCSVCVAKEKLKEEQGK